MKLTQHLAVLLVGITPALASSPRSFPKPPNSPYGYSPAAIPPGFELPHIDNPYRIRRLRHVEPQSEGASDVALACDLFLSRGADVFAHMSKEECMAAMGGFVQEARKGKADGEWLGELENLLVSLESEGKDSKPWL